MNPKEEMIRDIANAMAYEIETVKTGCREPRAIAVRSVCALALKAAGLPHLTAAKMVGMKSHTTISPAIERVESGIYDAMVPGGDAVAYATKMVDAMRAGGAA